jgi:hypothetical protein
LEKALLHTLVPTRLDTFKEKYHLTSAEKDKLSSFLHETKCEYARIFIPVQWKGDAADSCHEVFSLRSLKFLPSTKGLVEDCEGSKLPIGEVYYLEFLYYSDPTMDEYKNPSEKEIDIASRHGFIPMNTKYNIIYDN